MDVPGPSRVCNRRESCDSDGSNDPIQDIVNDSSSDESIPCMDLQPSDDDDDDEPLPAIPTWSSSDGRMPTLREIEFTKEETLLVPIPGDGKPIDFFFLLLDDIFLGEICRYTNQYAFEVVFAQKNLTPNSRINAWKDLTVEELKTFIGVLLHTGTIKLNRLQDYWRKEYLFNLKCISTFMSRDRYMAILRCLHFTSVNEQPNVKSTAKIDNVIFYFNNKMRSVYYPQKQLSLDEAMVLWRGRLHFRQYIKGKRHKYGLKLYTLTEHQGFILKFLLYAGQSDTIVGGKGHTEKVVMYLAKEYLDKGHSIYMDNFYNSYSLASKLLSHNTYCTGTLRAGRKNLPREVINAPLKKGETIERYSNGVMVGKWKDKRSVLYLSTEHENVTAEFINKRGVTKSKPLPIIKYNAFMSGVDRADQLMSYHPCERKTIRWYKKIFVHVIQMIMMNALTLYNKHKQKMNMYDFRLEIIRELLPNNIVNESPAQKRLRQEAHKLTKITERDANNKTKRKKCRYCCKKGKKNVKTTFHCVLCEDKPGLCMETCFEVYHDELN